MPKRLTPKKFVLVEPHPPQCSLHVNKIGEEKADIVHGWFEAGKSDTEIGQLSYQLGLGLTKTALGRHRANHLKTVAQVAEEKKNQPKIGDLDALEMILQQGASQIENWKVTPSDYFKALDMKYRLTQGSAFQGMLEALAVAEDDIDEDSAVSDMPDSPETQESGAASGVLPGMPEREAQE